MWYALQNRQDEQIWYKIHDWKKRDRYDMNYMTERRWTDMKWCTWMIEIYGYVMIYMNDRDIWIYDDLHEWQGYMDMLWCTWVAETNRLDVDYMIDSDNE